MKSKYVFTKHPSNPILRPDDLPAPCMSVFNPGAIRFKDETLIIADVLTLQGLQVPWMARSSDGVNFKFDPEPIDWPVAKEDCYRESMVYDPRITEIDGTYYLVYASQNNMGTCVGIATTRDFKKFELLPSASPSPNRNGVLFPEKIKDEYVRLDRPISQSGDRGDIWISYSPDLVYWGRSKPLMRARGYYWDRSKVGAGAVPIKTPEGWLIIYHGVNDLPTGSIYRLGVALLDLEDPSKVLSRGEDAVLWPQHDYEFLGRVPNVVFTCNAIVSENGLVRIYYGCADTCIGLAEAQLDDLVEVAKTRNPYVLIHKS
jgi:predicted GH43/DUF377 family glycosyl hydrolase